MRTFFIILTFAFVGLLAPTFAQQEDHKVWDYPPFGATDVALYHAFQESCERFGEMDSGRQLHPARRVFGTAGQWQAICADGLKKQPHLLEDFFKERLAKVKLSNSGKFTGYFKPVLEGSRKRHGPYQTPILAKPKDLTRCNGATGQLKPNGQCLNPYPTRHEIESNLAAHKVLVWVKDPLDAYFLHIQGSGSVELDDGSVMHIGFAGKNGHPYVAIGKVLKDRGELTGAITADSIRKWLKSHPDQALEILHSNPSYIFFKETREESPGAFGATLVAGRSLAVDKDSIALGIPVMVETTNTFDNSPWNRIMFAHDVGSAIKGPGRGDIYFGHGPLSGKRAGSQNAPGTLWAWVPKENVGEQAVAELEPSEGPTKPAPAKAKPQPEAAMPLALQSSGPQPVATLAENTVKQAVPAEQAAAPAPAADAAALDAIEPAAGNPILGVGPAIRQPAEREAFIGTGTPTPYSGNLPANQPQPAKTQPTDNIPWSPDGSSTPPQPVADRPSTPQPDAAQAVSSSQPVPTFVPDANGQDIPFAAKPQLEQAENITPAAGAKEGEEPSQPATPAKRKSKALFSLADLKIPSHIEAPDPLAGTDN